MRRQGEKLSKPAALSFDLCMELCLYCPGLLGVPSIAPINPRSHIFGVKVKATQHVGVHKKKINHPSTTRMCKKKGGLEMVQMD